MKNLLRLATVILTLTIVLSLSSSVFAQNATDDDDKYHGYGFVRNADDKETADRMRTPGIKTLIDFSTYHQRLRFNQSIEDETDKYLRIQNGTYIRVDPTQGNVNATSAYRDIYLAPRYRVTQKQMQMHKWRVVLNSSAQTVENRVSSYCKPVYLYDKNSEVRQDPSMRYQPTNREWDDFIFAGDASADAAAKERAEVLNAINKKAGLIFPGDAEITDADMTAVEGAGVASWEQNSRWRFPRIPADYYLDYEARIAAGTADADNGVKDVVLGARIRFPEHWFNAWAKVMPPFEINSYNTFRPFDEPAVQGEVKRARYGEVRNVGNGLIYNVGQIKWIRVKVAGRNFKNGLAVRLKDENNQVDEYFLGYLYYPSWRVLKWDNPNYIESIDHREVFKLPLYPKDIPFKKFESFVVYRQGDQVGGDFVLYFDNVEVNYDFALPPESDIDEIEDEVVWRIIEDASFEAAEKERKENADNIERRLQEKAIISNEDEMPVND